MDGLNSLGRIFFLRFNHFVHLARSTPSTAPASPPPPGLRWFGPGRPRHWSGVGDLLLERLDLRLLLANHALEVLAHLALLFLETIPGFASILVQLVHLICLLGLSDDGAQAKGRRPPYKVFQLHIFSSKHANAPGVRKRLNTPLSQQPKEGCWLKAESGECLPRL